LRIYGLGLTRGASVGTPVTVTADAFKREAHAHMHTSNVWGGVLLSFNRVWDGGLVV